VTTRHSPTAFGWAVQCRQESASSLKHDQLESNQTNDVQTGTRNVNALSSMWKRKRSNETVREWEVCVKQGSTCLFCHLLVLLDGGEAGVADDGELVVRLELSVVEPGMIKQQDIGKVIMSFVMW